MDQIESNIVQGIWNFVIHWQTEETKCILLLRFVLAGAARVLSLALVGCASTASVALAVLSAVAARS